MNNENQKNQEIEEQKTGNVWKDKILPWLKSFWEDEIKRWYSLAVLLEIIFFILQFVPFIEVLTNAKVTVLGVSGVKKEVNLMTNSSSMSSFSVVLNIVGLLLLFISFISTISYFFRKKNKMKSGFNLAKLAVIVLLLSFVLGIKAWVGYAKDLSSEIGGIVEVDMKDLISIKYFIAVLYVVVAVALFIILWRLSAIRKAKIQSGEFYIK